MYHTRPAAYLEIMLQVHLSFTYIHLTRARTHPLTTRMTCITIYLNGRTTPKTGAKCGAQSLRSFAGCHVEYMPPRHSVLSLTFAQHHRRHLPSFSSRWSLRYGSDFTTAVRRRWFAPRSHAPLDERREAYNRTIHTSATSECTATVCALKVRAALLRLMPTNKKREVNCEHQQHRRGLCTTRQRVSSRELERERIVSGKRTDASAEPRNERTKEFRR